MNYWQCQLTKSASSQLLLFTLQLLFNSNVLLPPAAKRVKLINFSEPKRRFGRRDNADCKQRGEKWSAEGPIAAWLKKNLPLYLIFLIIQKIFFFRICGFPVTADENEHRIWILHVKIHNNYFFIKPSFWMFLIFLLLR